MNQAKEKKGKVMSVECGGKTYIFYLADVVETPDGELQYKWKLLEGDKKEFFKAIYGVSVGDTEVEDSDDSKNA